MGVVWCSGTVQVDENDAVCVCVCLSARDVVCKGIQPAIYGGFAHGPCY